MSMTNGEPMHSLDIQQLKWALRTGKMDIWGSSPVENQPVVAESVSNTNENPPICTAVLDQIHAVEKMMNQELALFRNEFAVFIQAQVNQEKALRLSETEWQKKLVEHENKMLAELWEMRQSIIGEFTTYFQLIAEQMQNRDQFLHKEISSLKDQLNEIHQYQEYRKEEDLALAKEWKEREEEYRKQLIHCIQHIQKVLEEVSSGEKENRMQEDYLLKEIASVKNELEHLQQKYQRAELEPVIVDAESWVDGILEKNETQLLHMVEVKDDLNRKKKRRQRRG